MEAPNHKFLTVRTSFWNSSGLEVKNGGDGVEIKGESIASEIGGGIAFDDGPPNENGEKQSPQLFKYEKEVMTPQRRRPTLRQGAFCTCVQGIECRRGGGIHGYHIGSVTSVDLDYDAHTRRFL